MVVEGDAQQLVVRFDPSVRLIAGSMLALYGPGRVEKHPLTKEVIIETRKLVAKAQALTSSLEDGKLRARVTWSDGSALAAGLDVVPLPNDAAPNSPPVLGAGPLEFSAAGEGSVRVRLPISDPDGDQLSYRWSLRDAPGQAGVLDARTGGLPEVVWSAPGVAGQTTLAVVASDPFGQRLEVTVKLVAKEEEDVRKRVLHACAGFGALAQPSFARLTRDPEGPWVGIDTNGAVVRLTPGWSSVLPLTFPPDQAPRRPLAVRVHHRDLYVLDGKKQAVLVFAPDGTPRREFAACQAASDLALAPDGVAYIADQSAGGVLVYEANGKFRARLGRAEKGDDGFTGLTRIALAASGELYCLDVAQGQIQRFDRFQRRLETWTLQLDPRNPPLDIALHPKGLLVLLNSGQILQLNARGVASESWKGLTESVLVERPGNALALTVDAQGEVYVAYGEGLLARYNADGVVSGVRGAGLWGYSRFAADGRGRLYALDTDYGYIYQYDSEGFRVARLGGLAKSGGSLKSPVDLAVCPDGTALCVLDSGQSGVVRFNLKAPADKPLLFGQPGKNNGQFQNPKALAMDAAGRTYVLDYKQHRVQVFDAGGAFLYLFGHYDSGKLKDELSEPTRLAVDPRGTAAYVYDEDTYEIKKFALDAQANSASHVNNSGGKGDGPGQLRDVKAMGCDRLGLLYVIDSSRGDLQLMDFRGSNAIVAQVRKAADLGVRKLDSLALAPDGQIYLFYDGSGVGWRW